MRSRNPRRVLEQGTRLGEFEVVDIIGQGGYGDIYRVKSLTTSHFHAMKVEAIPGDLKGLLTEIPILKSLQDSPMFPRLIRFGSTATHRYLVMELLGPSLSNTRRRLFQRHYSLFSTLRLAFFMLQCLENYHRHGYVHCDIKPGNFLLCNNRNNPLKLIDYGLSISIVDKSTGETVSETQGNPFRGTKKYASIHSHTGLSLSQRDDLISLMYSLVEMVNGKLPWSSITKDRQIEKMKRSIPPSELFQSFPEEVTDIWTEISTLGYGEKPNYHEIYALLRSAITMSCFNVNIPFDWENLSYLEQQELATNFTMPRASDIVMDHLLASSNQVRSQLGEESCCTCCVQ